ncbi:MAG: hypothetical protein HY302_07200 [Opitutae bacterium]|nr:hypothetical protein [Opitutae bacterium]
MHLVQHGIAIGFQLGVLLFTSAGWGYLIYRSGRKANFFPPPAGDILICATAGLCLCFIVLQNLVYAGIKLEWSSWLGLSAAAAGLAFWWRDRSGSTVAPCARTTQACWLWLSSGLLVFCFQGAALIYHGPAHYYGNAHQDQVNYVQLAQFLVERPFSTSLADVGLHPWLVKAIDLKEMRIGQSVANGYVGVASLTDAQMAYGTTSLFFVGLLAACVTALLVQCSVRPSLAWLGGVWSGSLPAVTQTHLDGFLSQTTVLFVIPALGLSLLVARRNRPLGWVATTLILAFLLSAYTEVYVIGVASVAALTLVALEWPLRKRFAYFASTVAVSLLLLIPYVIRSLGFVASQYKIAADPEMLSQLAPRAGTLQGWAEIFVGLPSAAPWAQRAQPLAGLILVALALHGLASRSPRSRLRLVGLIAAPLGVLAVLLSAPVLAKYPLGKLLGLFAPLAAVCGTIGAARLGESLAMVLSAPARRGGLARLRRGSLGLAAVVIGLFLALAAADSWGKLQRVFANGDNLAAINSPAAQAVFRDIAAHPERTYLVKEQHVILNAWLCYHARHASVYTDVDLIGDRPTPVDQFSFRQVPTGSGAMWLLTGERMKSYSQVDATPEIIVRNPQGIDRAGLLTWYWVGDQMELEIVNFAHHPLERSLTMRAIIGPANDAPERTVSLTEQSDDRTKQIRRFTQDARLTFTLTLKPGSNFYAFRVEAPVAWQRHVAGDARKLSVRVQEFNLSTMPVAPGRP